MYIRDVRMHECMLCKCVCMIKCSYVFKSICTIVLVYNNMRVFISELFNGKFSDTLFIFKCRSTCLNFLETAHVW